MGDEMATDITHADIEDRDYGASQRASVSAAREHYVTSTDPRDLADATIHALRALHEERTGRNVGYFTAARALGVVS